MLRAVEAPSASVVSAAARFASWLGAIYLVVAMFLATFAHFVARAVVLLMRFVAARAVHANKLCMRIRARNGRLHRMPVCCTLGTDTCLFAGDAQLARTACSNSGSLSGWFDAPQIHSEHKSSRMRSDDDSIQISLTFLYAAALLGPPLPGPLLTYAAALLGPPLPGPLLTYSCDARVGAGGHGRRGWFRIVQIIYYLSIPISLPPPLF